MTLHFISSADPFTKSILSPNVVPHSQSLSGTNVLARLGHRVVCSMGEQRHGSSVETESSAQLGCHMGAVLKWNILDELTRRPDKMTGEEKCCFAFCRSGENSEEQEWRLPVSTVCYGYTSEKAYNVFLLLHQQHFQYGSRLFPVKAETLTPWSLIGWD